MNTVETRSDFAKNLIALRKNRGVSQRDLAERTGISRRMIAYYETNAAIPPIEKLNQIAQALGASIADLVDPSRVDDSVRALNTRTLKKVHLIEQLPPEEQKKVMEYAKDLLEKVFLQKQQKN